MGAEVKIVVDPLTKGLDALRVEWRKAKWIGRDGCVDLVIFLPGRLLWVEAKAPGETPRPNQKKEIALLLYSGQTAIVADSAELVEQILAYVDRHLHMVRAQPEGSLH